MLSILLYKAEEFLCLNLVSLGTTTVLKNYFFSKFIGKDFKLYK